MLPGAGSYQLRKKGCTSRNAADMLPLSRPGTEPPRRLRYCSLPAGTTSDSIWPDKKLSSAHHGLVVADTGSGKSSPSRTCLDALASGDEAILIDNGNSWEPPPSWSVESISRWTSRLDLALRGLRGDARPSNPHLLERGPEGRGRIPSGLCQGARGTRVRQGHLRCGRASGAVVLRDEVP